MSGRCECIALPPNGRFVVGNQYLWDMIIDGIGVKDEEKRLIGFGEINWLWYFKKLSEESG